MSTPRFLQTTLTAAALLHALAAHSAGVVNGTFENGSFAGWNVQGTAAIAYQGSPHAPLSGAYSALLVNTNGGSGCITPADVWNCLPPPIPFVPQGGPAVTYHLTGENSLVFARGSYMAQDMVVDAGQVLRFDYRFIHPDVDGLRVLVINESGWQMSPVIGGFGLPSTGEFSGVFSYRFQQAGLWSVYIGTFQAKDPTIYSVGQFDNITLLAVPEPGSGALALLAAACYGLMVRRAARNAT